MLKKLTKLINLKYIFLKFQILILNMKNYQKYQKLNI